MKTNIDFFSQNFINSIGAGIYEVEIDYSNEKKSLYIGESVFVLVRCATHLYYLKNNPNYWGFDEKSIEKEDITLRFKLIEKENNKQKRKAREKELIRERKPITQSGISDRMKGIDEKVNEVTELLKHYSKFNET